jgi:glycosyltransferase involved in cell wall biosynthesis
VNTTNPLISIIMPVFNGKAFLPAALESVMAQDYPNLEMITVDDGSTDESEKILESFAHFWSGPINILTHPARQNRGIAASYRLGLEHCHGKYVAFLEHDDFWPPNKISEQVKIFNTFNEVGVVFSDVYLCDEKGRISTKAFKPLINSPPSERPFNAFPRLVWGNCLSTFSNVMVRQDLIDIYDIINQPEGFQDWMLLLLLSRRCKFYHCTQTKTFWRQRQDSCHSKLMRAPKYTSLRKLALRNAIGKHLHEVNASDSNHLYKERYLKSYWYSIISLFTTAERVADFVNRRFFNRGITSFTRNTSV